MLAEIAGEKVAQTIQLGLEYAPAPPFNSGRPELASPDVLASFETMRAAMMLQRRTEAEAAAAGM